jgi:hypothetical protein
VDRIKFENFVKEVYLDSDTTVGLLSGATFDDPNKWFLTSDQIKAAADDVNGLAGTKRLLYRLPVVPAGLRLRSSPLHHRGQHR